jgi:hypothetical protein
VRRGGEIPYDELDPPIVELVRVLNELPGIETLGSCAGHEDPRPGAWPADRWFVTFILEPADPEALAVSPSPEAWVSLEWLVWLVNGNLARAGRRVELVPSSPPPYLNHPSRMLRFAIEGGRGEQGIEPADLAEEIERLVPELYIPAEEILDE